MDGFKDHLCILTILQNPNKTQLQSLRYSLTQALVFSHMVALLDFSCRQEIKFKRRHFGSVVHRVSSLLGQVTPPVHRV